MVGLRGKVGVCGHFLLLLLLFLLFLAVVCACRCGWRLRPLVLACVRVCAHACMRVCVCIVGFWFWVPHLTSPTCLAVFSFHSCTAGTNSRRMGPSSGIVEQVSVPNHTVGLIIGKQGSTIKMIQDQSGAHIQVPREPDAGNPNTR